MSRILVVDDDPAIRRSLQIQLDREGHEVATAASVEAGREAIERAAPELVFLDLNFPEGSGLELLRTFGEREDLAVVMISGVQDMMSTIEAIRLGAFDYIRKPLDRGDILAAVEKAKRYLERVRGTRQVVGLAPTAHPRELVGRDRRIVDVIKQIGLLSQTRVTVLINGETGTGKELVARAIHEATTPGAPFVAINCAAIVESLLESELFGHEQGAFTGAEQRKIGKLELAGDGTIFLDEVGDMSLEVQASLLRALEARSFERVGGNAPCQLRARIVAATHRDLGRLAGEGAFRRDLLYRLAVARVNLPPLRERVEDIPLLVRHLLGRIGDRIGRHVDGVTPRVLEQLQSYDWPGNVRELDNVLTSAIALGRDAVLDTLPPDVCPAVGPPATSLHDGDLEPTALRSLRAVERAHVLRVLRALEWNITRSARVLEISPTTLRKKIADYELRADRGDDPRAPRDVR